MDWTIGASVFAGKVRREGRGPQISRDLLMLAEDGGRCPKDQGLLVLADGEELIIRRCVNCGYRQYSAMGKVVAKISQRRALADAANAENANRVKRERRGGGNGE